MYSTYHTFTHTHTHTRVTTLFPGLPWWAGTRKVKLIWILLKQETVSGSGISWGVFKSAPSSRQITMPTPHHSLFYMPDALPVAQPTASKHWRQQTTTYHPFIHTISLLAENLHCPHTHTLCLHTEEDNVESSETKITTFKMFKLMAVELLFNYIIYLLPVIWRLNFWHMVLWRSRTGIKFTSRKKSDSWSGKDYRPCQVLSRCWLIDRNDIWLVKKLWKTFVINSLLCFVFADMCKWCSLLVMLCSVCMCVLQYVHSAGIIHRVSISCNVHNGCGR